MKKILCTLALSGALFGFCAAQETETQEVNTIEELTLTPEILAEAQEEAENIIALLEQAAAEEEAESEVK